MVTPKMNLDGEGTPYPGMAAAFEAHFGQSWTDPEWRSEAATWAAAWIKSRTSALMDACESIQAACINGELSDVCEDAIRVIKIA